ncbi:chitin binding lectin, putative [Entamoeba invadens IP1]|uniref:Chitin binding lectin, putative n=2 Tax=Entamoeba invadens TaxID=33085 RepID=A0A0A1U3H5_ENTIV|nr:chitin binding lectin, putative [Entamoeba invadens IP1]ABC59329.2 Jessie 3b [Entamoeba invadens]ELP87298.1 chitin binding lectin, putative [Entamoeba invadens IP1]|eukprot:XP_004254069.1 chitin binding lectin, putative [Entamoeba invadens IP1]
MNRAIITLLFICAALSRELRNGFKNITRTATRTNCNGLDIGFYCVDKNTYNWCFGQSAYRSTSCPAGLECKCGFTTMNPCAWSYQDLGNMCVGKPGDYFVDEEPEIPSEEPSKEPESSGNDDSFSENIPSEEPEGSDSYNPEWPDVEDGVYSMKPSAHLPLVLKFDKDNWQEQIKEVVKGENYYNEKLYTPVDSNYECALHPPKNHDNNPTQMWIGRPSETVTISYTPGVAVRLPDKYYGLFLGYAMDAYGLNPGMLIGLGAKESFSFTRFDATDDGSYFIVEKEDEHYDCYSNSQRGLCRDGNLDGPFQVETGGMSTDVAILPNRFYVGDNNTSKDKRKILYMFDNEVLTSAGFREYHDYYTLNVGRAFVLSSLDFHFRHNLVMKMKKIGLGDAMKKRTTREARDSLEFATAMYTYNRGVFDTQLIAMLGNCDADMDPCLDCKLDGYGGHTTDIRTVCKVVDSAPNEEIYDYELKKEDVDYFVDILETTFPFDNVDWAQVRTDVKQAYQFLSSMRKKDTISFRYDWRALLAVVRMHLPAIEYFVGEQVKSFQNYWGSDLNTDLGPYQNVTQFPYSFCSTAGGRKNLCK